MNTFEKTCKRLGRHGLKVRLSSKSSLFGNETYVATKDGRTISFCYSPQANRIFKIEVLQDSDSDWYKVKNVTAALREVGCLSVRTNKKETREQRLKRVIHRWMSSHYVSDDEILSLELFTKNAIKNAFYAVYPQLNEVHARRSAKRDRLYGKCESRTQQMWAKMLHICQEKYPNQPPLRKVRICVNVDVPVGVSLDYYQPCAVEREVPIFAWDAGQAEHLASALMGGSAEVRDYGICAVGPKEKALESLRDVTMKMTSTNAKYALEKSKNEYNKIVAELENAKMRIEYAEKLNEMASFVDAVANMTTMLNEDSVQ